MLLDVDISSTVPLISLSSRRNNWGIMCFLIYYEAQTGCTVTTFFDMTEHWNQSSQILVHLAQKCPVSGKPRRSSFHADSAITNKLFKPAPAKTCPIISCHLRMIRSADVFSIWILPARIFSYFHTTPNTGAHKAHLFTSTGQRPVCVYLNRFTKQSLDQTTISRRMNKHGKLTLSLIKTAV